MPYREIDIVDAKDRKVAIINIQSLKEKINTKGAVQFEHSSECGQRLVSLAALTSIPEERVRIVLPSLVYNWMPGGTLTTYLQNNPRLSYLQRLCLVCLV